jgi:hypothetical protein
MISHLVIGLDEEVHTKQSIPAFGFCLGRFSKEKVSGIKEKDLPPFFFHLGDKSRFLGDPTKRTSESATGFHLTHHIVSVDDAELNFGCSLVERINK